MQQWYSIPRHMWRSIIIHSSLNASQNVPVLVLHCNIVMLCERDSSVWPSWRYYRCGYVDWEKSEHLNNCPLLPSSHITMLLSPDRCDPSCKPTIIIMYNCTDRQSVKLMWFCGRKTPQWIPMIVMAMFHTAIACCTMGTGSFTGVNRPERGVKHPPPSSAEVQNE
jgi:hypothetical protein